jgi:long-chain acyl-CoA synthetase
VARLFRDRVAAMPTAEAFRYPDEGRWQSVSWEQTGTIVTDLAAGLLALGVRPEERVAIISTTRIEWIYADLAITCAGGATTTVYPSTGAEDITFILSDSESVIAFAETDEHLEILRDRRASLPNLRAVITFDAKGDDDWVLSLDHLSLLGAEYLARHPGSVAEATNAIQPEHLASLMYTSGTTGRPKGVELPHRCWTYVGAGVEALDLIHPQDLHYLWLPLSHAFGKMLVAVQLQIGFATAIDGRIDRIVENLAIIRPTFMAGPPRIFEKGHAKVLQTVESENALRRALFARAFEVGRRMSAARLEHRRPGALLRAEHAVADRLVLAKIRARLGGRIRFLVSGSAGLSDDVARWFYAAGLTVLNGYGLTETSAAVSIVLLQDPAIGVAGPPFVGTQIKLADDGEILVRGPSVMRGYHNLPEATGRVFDAEGWFATGDIGEFDAAGRLRITDRKKDLIKTSGGKYIAPQVIEVTFKAICPVASQMLIHAGGRNYATALITLDPEALVQWARAHALPADDYATLAADPAVRLFVASCVAQLNGRLNRWETIKDFRILDHDLSIENGEITPSMKVKRTVIETKYRTLLDSMYETTTQRGV